MGRSRVQERLNGATLMQSSFCLHVGFMRSFWCIVDAKIRARAFVDNLGHKPTWMPYHAKKSSRASALGYAFIFGVRSPANLPQIGKSIVSFVAVNVVNFLYWPFSSHVQKSKLMCHATEAVKHDVNVAIVSQRTGSHPNLFSSFGLQVSEFSSFWAVMRKLKQACVCNHVAPYQSGKPSKVAASGDESPVPRRVSCHAILQAMFAKSSDCGTIKALSRPGHQQLTRPRMKK